MGGVCQELQVSREEVFALRGELHRVLVERGEVCAGFKAGERLVCIVVELSFSGNLCRSFHF